MSGNANANLFFKRHGVNELQSKSEKKYSTKAAQEYRKYLQKSLVDSAGADRRESMDSQDDKDNSGEWGAEKGLDNLIKSVSGEGLNEKEGGTGVGGETPSTVFTNVEATAPAAAPAAPVVAASAPPAVILKKTPSNPDIGTISVALQGSSISNTAATKGPIKVGTLGRGPKKIGAKKIGARKLSSSNTGDNSLESFEKVEERTEAVTQEVEDHKLAMKLQSTENQAAGSSRLAAVYAEAESVYTTPAQTNNYSQGGSSPYGTSSSSSANSMPARGGNPNAYSHIGAGDAVERFGKNAKSISSDAYFERNKVDVREMQSRLDKYRGASSISSDMLNGNEEAAARARADSDDGLAVLKDSVKDFFSQIG